MPDINVDFERESLKKTIATLLRVGKGIAFLTPTNLDDQVLNVAEQLTAEEWFYDLVDLVLGLVKQGKTAVAMELLKKALEENQA